jgi:hypothetical protein
VKHTERRDEFRRIGHGYHLCGGMARATYLGLEEVPRRAVVSMEIGAPSTPASVWKIHGDEAGPPEAAYTLFGM